MAHLASPTLSADIAALLALLQERAAQDNQGLTCLPAYLADSQRLATELVLAPEELGSETDTQDRATLYEEIAAYVRRVREGYSYITGEPLPDWLKRYQKKDGVFFEAFFRNITHVPSVTDDIATRTGKTLESVEALYEQWLDTQAQLDARSAIARKIMRAFDLRASLIGMLRLIGVPSGEIQEAME